MNWMSSNWWMGGGNFEIGMSGRLGRTSFTLGGLGGLGVLSLLTDLEVLLFLLESATFGVMVGCDMIYGFR